MDIQGPVLEELDKPASVDFSNEPIVINAELDASPINNIDIQEYIAREVKDLFKDRPTFEPIESTVRCEPGRAFVHNNYMHYLTLAWNNHLSVIISPDIVFYTILCEIASSVKADPETYRHLFTTSTEKIKIMSITHAPHVIDLDQIIKGIAQHSPIDSSLFTADFTSSTIESRLALQAAFCDAMSPYFHYSRTACGIPRVKVLGTKQDWMTLQRKVHLLATEVFAQDIDMEKSLAKYLSTAEKVIAKIHSTRDPKFWENMFSIGGCFSGHTHMVTGWITQLYRNGKGDFEHRQRGCHGDDYYNYESHISTVSWRCAQTTKEFELRTGLLYSVINDQGQEMDKKFPWFEPQFGHVVLDKNYKMTAEQFQEYIDTVLQGGDKRLWQTFYELLKDDPVMMDKGPGELKQRLDIARRQMAVWKKNSKDGVQAELDLENSDFGSLLYMHIDKTNAEVEKFMDDLVEYMQTMKIPKIVTAQSGVCAGAVQEGRVLRALIGNEVLEDLTVSCFATEDDDSAMSTLCELLAHPKCRIRNLVVSGPRLKKADEALLGSALLKSNAPIERLNVLSAEAKELADAIYFYATERNLKAFTIQYPLRYFYGEDIVQQMEVAERIFHAMRDSRSIEEIKVHNFGDVKFLTKDGAARPVETIFEELAANIKLNTNLKELTIEKWEYSEDLLTELVAVPSLRSIMFVECPDSISLDFLDVTKKLESFIGSFDFTTDMVEKLSNFLADPACNLRQLSIRGSKFNGYEDEEELLTTLTKSLINNKSLTDLNLDSVKVDETDKSFIDYIVAAIKNGMPIQKLTVDHLPKDLFNAADLEKLLLGLTTCTTLRYFKSNLPIVSEEGFNAVLQILRNNPSLQEFDVNYYRWSDDTSLLFTEEQQNLLISAAKALPNIERFGVNGVQI